MEIPVKISNKKLDQLRKYAEWEKREYPDDKWRTHVLDWAVDEITGLRLENNKMRAALERIEKTLIRLWNEYS